MSALPSKADIQAVSRSARYGPKAAVSAVRQPRIISRVALAWVLGLQATTRNLAILRTLAIPRPLPGAGFQHEVAGIDQVGRRRFDAAKHGHFGEGCRTRRAICIDPDDGVACAVELGLVEIAGIRR